MIWNACWNCSWGKIAKRSFLLAVWLGCISLPLLGQPHTPRGALWRAIVLPGWGQVYNHDYWKLPIVYGGLVASISATAYYSHWYGEYRHAYLYAAYLNTSPHPYIAYRETYEALGSLPASILRQQRNRLRRNRDLAIMSIGLAYALSVLDAYVSAQLMDFDVSPDLSLHIYPGTRGIAIRLLW